jgi:hypothetical protein
MTMDEIREFAKALDIQSVNKFESKEDLIRTIQLAEGNTDCFRRIPDCANERCAWYDDCIKNPNSND